MEHTLGKELGLPQTLEDVKIGNYHQFTNLSKETPKNISQEPFSENSSGLWEHAPHRCFSARLHGSPVPSSCEIK